MVLSIHSSLPSFRSFQCHAWSPALQLTHQQNIMNYRLGWTTSCTKWASWEDRAGYADSPACQVPTRGWAEPPTHLEGAKASPWTSWAKTHALKPKHNQLRELGYQVRSCTRGVCRLNGSKSAQLLRAPQWCLAFPINQNIFPRGGTFVKTNFHQQTILLIKIP